MAYAWREFFLPLAAGIDTKSDPRALQPPSLAVARDVQFEEVGGLQTRYPFASIGTDILGGGSISECRRIVANGDELLLFTKEALYSWSESGEAWVLKDTHLAVETTESSQFVRTNDQTGCDRAEMDGVVFYAWTDVGAASGVYLAAIDAETGAVLLSPTAVGSSSSRPRLVVMATQVLLFYLESTTVSFISIDPAAPSAGGTATVHTTNCNDYYDVVAHTDGSFCAFACRRAVTSAYLVNTLTDALVSDSRAPARTCDGPIAVSIPPTGTHVQVIRANGTNIQGDLVLVSTLADVYTAQAVGTVPSTPVNQIAACHRSVQDSSVYRCYAFWDYDETVDDAAFATWSNWVSTGNTLGTEARFRYRLGVASRAFDRDGEIYVWLAFAGESAAGGMAEPLGFRAQLQNAYFLYRDDQLLCGKAASARAGGFSAATGHLPHVQSLGDDIYTWCGVEKQVISLGGSHTGYGARAPRDIRIEFDSDAARRCVRLGKTLYITGGQILQYDGEGLAEVGFHIYPWYFDSLDGGAGGKDAGDFTYKATWRWQNAVGESERSTTATYGQITLAASRMATFTIGTLNATLKFSPRADVAIELWGTLANPSVDAPFYLLTSKDPSDSTTPNQYLVNSVAGANAASFDDEMADDDAAKLEVSPENGGILENLAPPPASIIAATQDRIFLAGVAGDPDRVWYSKLRGVGEVAAFHDALTIDVPHEGGAITALAFLDGILIVFRETAAYALPGDGFDNAAGGQNYGPARRLSADVGAVSAEAVATAPQGLVFKSRKGWYLLGRGGSVEYIGGPVAAFDGDTVKAVHVVETQHQVRCLTGSRMLIWDYAAASADGRGQWAEWTISDGLGACIWDGTYHYVATAAVKEQLAAHTSLTYAMDVETPWMRWGELTSAQAWRWLMVVGEYRSAFDLRIRIAYDGAESDSGGVTWTDDITWTVSPTTVGGPLLARIGPSRIRGNLAVKIRLTAYAVGSAINPPTGEAMKLTGIGFEVGSERGLFRRLPAAQKT